MIQYLEVDGYANEQEAIVIETNPSPTPPLPKEISELSLLVASLTNDVAKIKSGSRQAVNLVGGKSMGNQEHAHKGQNEKNSAEIDGSKRSYIQYVHVKGLGVEPEDTKSSVYMHVHTKKRIFRKNFFLLLIGSLLSIAISMMEKSSTLGCKRCAIESRTTAKE